MLGVEHDRPHSSDFEFAPLTVNLDRHFIKEQFIARWRLSVEFKNVRDDVLGSLRIKLTDSPYPMYVQPVDLEA